MKASKLEREVGSAGVGAGERARGGVQAQLSPSYNKRARREGGGGGVCGSGGGGGGGGGARVAASVASTGDPVIDLADSDNEDVVVFCSPAPPAPVSKRPLLQVGGMLCWLVVPALAKCALESCHSCVGAGWPTPPPRPRHLPVSFHSHHPPTHPPTHSQIVLAAPPGIDAGVVPMLPSDDARRSALLSLRAALCENHRCPLASRPSVSHDPGCGSLALAAEAETACLTYALHAVQKGGRDKGGGGGGGGGGGSGSGSGAASSDADQQRAKVAARYAASLQKRVAAIEDATGKGVRVALPRAPLGPPM